MGGNTYKRRSYTDKELYTLVNKVNDFSSLFCEKTHKDEKQWRAEISRHLDSDSCNRFYFILEDTHYCEHCGIELNIDSYVYTGYARGFSKYCPECTEVGVWRKRLSADALKSRGNSISAAKRQFYSTQYGKEVAKKNGRKISISLKKFHRTEDGAKSREKCSKLNSKIMKEKIMNGSFTPNSNNSNTHWDSEYNGKKYRSSWGALYHCLYPTAIYEDLRLKYTYENKEYIYIVDFIDHERKVACEVKPKEHLLDSKTKCKIVALEKWASKNGYNVELFTQDAILLTEEPDYTLFDKNTERKLRKLYEQVKN